MRPALARRRVSSSSSSSTQLLVDRRAQSAGGRSSRAPRRSSLTLMSISPSGKRPTCASASGIDQALATIGLRRAPRWAVPEISDDAVVVDAHGAILPRAQPCGGCGAWRGRRSRSRPRARHLDPRGDDSARAGGGAVAHRCAGPTRMVPLPTNAPSSPTVVSCFAHAVVVGEHRAGPDVRARADDRASPTYVRWLAFERPSPRRAFLVSVKLPTLAPSLEHGAHGRRCEKGPTSQSSSRSTRPTRITVARQDAGARRRSLTPQSIVGA